MRLLRSIAIGSAVVLVTTAVPLLAPTAVKANAAEPEKLWGGFSSPVSIAFAADGHLYDAEWRAGRVSRIAPDGSRTIFSHGLSGPSGLALGHDDAIYVATYLRDEIYRFTPDGVHRACDWAHNACRHRLRPKWQTADRQPPHEPDYQLDG